MYYKNTTISIGDLIKLSLNKTLDLSPSYQRGFIWSLSDQKDLIRTISKGYPLPNLFIRILKNGTMEMVDGQQRTRSIIKYFNNELKITVKDNIQFTDKQTFLSYNLQVVYIYEIDEDQVRELYYFINKKGVNLNDPERQKAYYSDTLFLKLAEEISNNQDLINFELFSDKTISRLNNRDFIQELLGYLIKYNEDLEKNINLGFEGIRDKKNYIEKELFLNDINQAQYDNLLNSFKEILKVLTMWNNISPINKTRYKQKSDFYTMVCFINKHKHLSKEILEHQYKILLVLSQKDEDGNQFIRPTNEKSIALKSYAINCVSQSNSKNAREERLIFWESILLNQNPLDSIENNEIFEDILTYFAEVFTYEKINLIPIGKYYLMDVELINS